MNKKQIEEVSKILSIYDENIEKFKEKLFNKMFPGPFYHKMEKNLHLGKEEIDYDMYGNHYYRIREEDEDKQFYYCTKMNCRFEISEDDIYRYNELGINWENQIPGCCPPSFIKDKNINIYFERIKKEINIDSYPDDYIKSFYIIYRFCENKEIEEFTIDNFKDKETKKYFDFLSWLIKNKDNIIINIMSYLVYDCLIKNRSFDE